MTSTENHNIYFMKANEIMQWHEKQSEHQRLEHFESEAAKSPNNRHKHKGKMQNPPICYLDFEIPPHKNIYCKCPPHYSTPFETTPLHMHLLILPVSAYMEQLQVMHQVKFVPILGLGLLMILRRRNFAYSKHRFGQA